MMDSTFSRSAFLKANAAAAALGDAEQPAVKSPVVYYTKLLVPQAFLCYHRVKTGRVPPARRYEECLRCFPAEYS